MSEDYLIRNCAPTLAGIKTANLFSCPCPDRAELVASLCRLNSRLCRKGLRVVPLRFSEKNALIYLYRPRQLAADLCHGEAMRILNPLGYDCAKSEQCLVRLARKLRAREEFPHEIGLFLGYPPADVCGFIENKPCTCKCVGCWKVYGDEYAARRRFAAYQSCTANYCRRRAGGASLEGLTVSRLPQ